MKKNLFVNALLIGLMTNLSAQTLQPKDLAGFWRMKMDINIDGLLRGEGNDDPLTACLLKITPKDNGEFDGEFTQCNQEKYIAGSLYNNRLMNAVVYANEGQKYVYTGRVTPNGTIKGNYFTPSCLYGEFELEKVLEQPASASPADENMEDAPMPTPIPKGSGNTKQAAASEYKVATNNNPNARKIGERVESYQVEKTVLIDDTHPFDPNIPMAQAYNGTDALYVGNFAGSYKTVYETETRVIPIYADPEPVVESVKEAPKYEFKKYEMATAATSAASPTAMPIPEKAIKKIDICDSTVPGIKPDYVERGKKISNATGDFHIVGHGETMYTISRYYGISISNLIEWNEKNCEHLRQGEKLRISAPRS